jgi:hypothetical protein
VARVAGGIALLAVAGEDGPSYEPIWVAGRSGDLVLSWGRRAGSGCCSTGPCGCWGRARFSIPSRLVHVVFPPPPQKAVPVLTFMVGPGSYEPGGAIGLALLARV